MSLGTFLRQLRRESRGSRRQLLFFVACLMIGVAAVVAVAGFCEGIDRGVRGEARQLLAADLAVRGRRPVPEELKEAVDQIPGARRADLLEMLTLVAAEGASQVPGTPTSQLVELKSTAGGYPFYGTLDLDPPRSLDELLDPEGTVVGPEVTARLGLGIGDRLKIGEAVFTLRGIVHREPDRIAGAFNVGPRVFVSAAGLERAGLERFGSRILYRTLVALPPERADELEAIAQGLEAHLGDAGRHRLETWRQAQPALRRGLERMERYLGLAALLSLLVGGVGVAQTVRAWLAGRMDAIAVFKCLGYRPREVLALYLGQAAFLGLVASLLGIALGIAVQALVARLLAGVMPVEYLELWQPLAVLKGLGLGIGVAVLFSLPPLVTAQRTPPVRVLRRDAEPLPPSRWAQALTGAALVLGVFLLASAQSRSFVLGARFTAGLLAVTAVLALAAWGLVRLAVRPRRFVRGFLRQGLSALARPGASTVGAIVALGLGVLVVLTMFLVESRLVAQFQDDVPEDAPSAFLVDIQPDQWPGVQDVLARHGTLAVDSVPVVMARFASLDGVPVEELVERHRDEDGEERWALRREQRLTYLGELPAGNEVVSGALWSKPGVPEVSVESEYAAALGLGVGSAVVIDVQGVPLELEVTSVRTVDWGTFGINFYLVVEPGVLDDAPQHRIAAVRLPEGAEQAFQDDLVRAFPNVTMIRVREVLDRIASILRQLGLGVQVLGWLTVAAGLAILGGAVSAGALKRGREVALLKTLGMTRRQVVAGFAAEYALVGLVAGTIGSVGAGVAAWQVLERGMELEWTLEPLGHLGAVAGAIVLTVAAGLVASVRALARRPVEALRAADG